MRKKDISTATKKNSYLLSDNTRKMITQCTYNDLMMHSHCNLMQTNRSCDTPHVKARTLQLLQSHEIHIMMPRRQRETSQYWIKAGGPSKGNVAYGSSAQHFVRSSNNTEQMKSTIYFHHIAVNGRYSDITKDSEYLLPSLRGDKMSVHVTP